MTNQQISNILLTATQHIDAKVSALVGLDLNDVFEAMWSVNELKSWDVDGGTAFGLDQGRGNYVVLDSYQGDVLKAEVVFADD